MNMHKSPSNINRLKTLVNELSDRDTQMRKDHSLFEDFFENFPIPVTVWSITKDHTIVSQKGHDFTCKKASCLDEMFQCPVIKETSLEKHELALKGSKVEYIVSTGDSTYYAKLVPRFNDNHEVVGVTGIAWNVTSNAVMLSCMEEIVETTTGRRGGYKQIHDVARKALSSSRLKILIDSLEVPTSE